MSKNDYQLKELEKLVSLAKRRGIIFPSSEIYGGLSSVWDYGPIGVEIKRNVKNLWWKSFVTDRDDIFGIDASILMHPDVWKASGHLDSFSDPLVECSVTGKRYREDHIFILEIQTKKEKKLITIEASDKDEAKKLVKDKIISITPLTESKNKENPSPEGGILSEPRNFNLMFKTFIGPVEDSSSTVYLRPETAQAMFVNFVNVLNTSRKKLPFGIAQQGKSFRNEITPGNFTFRTREFEQMEMEFFCKLDETSKWLKYWCEQRMKWFESLGINKDKLRLRAHGDDELAHYSSACFDIEYKFDFGWSEIEGIADRGTFDLDKHMKASNKKLTYFDQPNNEHFVPAVVEASAGVDRVILTILADAFTQEDVNGDPRTVLKLSPKIAPIKVAVFPLMNKNNMPEIAQKIVDEIRLAGIACFYDTGGSIGKRYRRQDEAGTPYGITVDHDTLEDNTVTLRDRDTMEQIRIPISKIIKTITEKIN